MRSSCASWAVSRLGRPPHALSRRIAARDPDDWPTIALALTLDLPVWSQDKDLADSGLKVFTTGQLLDALADTGDGG